MSWVSVAAGWIETHSGAVQAVGSVLAIIVGFGAVYWQRSREEREARQLLDTQGYALSVRLQPFVLDYLSTLENVQISVGEIPLVTLPEPMKQASPELYVLKDTARGMIALYAESQASELRWQKYADWNTVGELAAFSGIDGYRDAKFLALYGSALAAARSAAREIEVTIARHSA